MRSILEIFKLSKSGGGVKNGILVGKTVVFEQYKSVTAMVGVDVDYPVKPVADSKKSSYCKTLTTIIPID